MKRELCSSLFVVSEKNGFLQMVIFLLSFSKIRLKMARIPFFVLFIFFAIQSLQAQNKKAIDSLMRVYAKASDTTQMLLMVDIAFLYHRSKPDTCIAISQQIIERSDKIRYPKGKGRGWNSMAAGYRIKSNYPRALECQQKSLKIGEEIGDKQGIANSLAGMGLVYRLQGNYPQALEYQIRSLKISEEIQNKQDIANSLNNIGNIYNTQGNKTLALEYYLKSLKVREEIGDKIGLGNSFGSISIIYENQGNYPLALEYLLKAQKLFEELKDRQSIAIVLEHIGNIHEKQNQYPLALDYLFKSLKMSEEIGDKEGMTYPLRNIAIIYKKQKDYDKSIEYAQKGLQIAKEVKATPQIRQLSQTLYEAHKLKGEHAKALEYHEAYKNISDSIFTVDKSKALANLESKLEVERKQKEIEALNKDNKLQQMQAEKERMETEKERNARLAIEKQAEAEMLRALAREEQDKHKQDSLLGLAQKSQLEADNLKMKEKQLKAESKAQELEISKEKEARRFREYVVYLMLAGFVSVVIFAYVLYRSRQKEKRAKQEVLQKNEEIQMQAEEIRTQRDKLVESSALLEELLEETQSQRDVLDIQKQELKQKNEEISIAFGDLAEVNATKDKLFAIIGHDLRSPINSLLSMLTMLNNQYITQEEFVSFSGNLKSGVENVHFTLNNLLAWANSQMRGLQTRPENIRIHSLVEQNFQFLGEVAKAKGIQLQNQIASEWQVWADTDQINLVFRNLISNALKFTPNGGLVSIEASQKEGVCEVAIHDNGIGMSEKQINQLFKQTTHFSTHGTMGEKGTGIGLLLCQEMIEKNNGKIWAESQIGKGTTFKFSLPVASNA